MKIFFVFYLLKIYVITGQLIGLPVKEIRKDPITEC